MAEGKRQLEFNTQEESIRLEQAKFMVNPESPELRDTRLAPGSFHPRPQCLEPQLWEQSPIVKYKLNHFVPRISDSARTFYFYMDIMGMMTVVIFNGGYFTIYFLGYPSTKLDRIDLHDWVIKLATPGMLG